jgi:hypothetical protein
VTEEGDRRPVTFVLTSIGATVFALFAGAVMNALGGAIAALISLGQLRPDQTVLKAEIERIASTDTVLGLAIALGASSLAFAGSALAFGAPSWSAPDSLASRFRLRRGMFTDVVVVSLGMLGLSMLLGSLVRIFDWTDLGAQDLSRRRLEALDHGPLMALVRDRDLARHW